MTFGTGHVIQTALNSNNSFQIEAVDIVDGTNGDFGIGILHNSLDCITALANNASN